MFTTIITYCKGDNEAGRQITRFNSLGLGPTTLIGVDSGLTADSTIEAAGNLIDALDASGGREGAVVANVAPRGNSYDGENGTRFCYFYYKKTLVVSTIGGYTLSLVNKFGIVKEIKLLDVAEVLDFAVSEKLITKYLAGYIAKSQFRSFDFVPRVARWLIDGINIPFKTQLLATSYTLPSCIWHIDTFGNTKLTLTTKDLKLNTKNLLKINSGDFKFYERLKDVPYGKTAIYIGSSGIGEKRFLEIATQGKKGSVAKKLNLKVGKEIKFL